MKKILSAALASLMLLGGSSAVFADDVPAVAGLTLADTSHLVLDTEKGYVDMIDGTITVADLKAEFASDITVTGKDGVKADDKAVATDDTVSAGDASLKALIYGDVDRNGKITLTDASGIMKLSAKWDADINTDAADVDKNGKANLADASKLLKFAAGWDDISLGNVRWVLDNTKLTAEHEDSTLDLFFTSSMNKIMRHEIAHTGNNSYKMKLAKNEAESCQFIVTSENAVDGLSVELGDFVHEYGEGTLSYEIHQIFYYPNYSLMVQVAPEADYSPENWKNGDVPEVMLPLSDSFELDAKMGQAFVITVTSVTDTPAGMYKAPLTVKNAAGETVKCAEVCAYVWDFALPDAPYSASLFATSSYDVPYVDAFELMLDYNLSSYVLPYDVYTDEADAYMSDPRVTAFVIAGGGHMYGGIMDETDANTKLGFDKVMQNPEWAKKGLFYYTDEPYGTGLESVRTTYEHLISILGTEEGVRNMTPLAGDNSYANDQCMIDGISPVEFIDPYINLWCPQSFAFHLRDEGGRSWTLTRFYNKFGEFADKAKALKAAGEEMWWYVCCSPEVPYANYFAFQQGAVTRVLSWQQYFNDVDGVLYYATGIGWGSITKNKFDIGTGDGTLLYPANKFGFEPEMMPSVRLMVIRDGFDDFDYMRMAEGLVGREAVMEIVRTVSTGMVYYTEDFNVVEAARDAVAELILENAEK